MKHAKKTRTLLLPLSLIYLALFLAALVYGAARYFALAGGFSWSEEALATALFEAVPAFAAVLIAALGTSITLFVRYRRPARRITGAVRRLTRGLETDLPTEPIEAYGELAALSEALYKEHGALKEFFAARTARTAEETDRATRLDIARSVYREAVPERVSIEAINFGISGRTVLSEEVGADFFDAFRSGRKIVIAAGDVWGKGLPAALFASRMKAELRGAVFAGKNLAETLVSLNTAVCGFEDLFLTLFLALFDPETGDLRYVNAGHPAPVLADGKRTGFLRVRAGSPLGVSREYSAEEGITRLQPGQGIVFYTDGAISSRNEEGECYGYDRLLRSARGLFSSAIGADYIADELVRAVEEFSPEREDDLLLAALYYPNGVHRIFRPELSETETVKQLLLEWLAGDPRKKKIILVCEEIFTNIVRHAGATAIQMSCMREESKLILRFTDDGEPFDPLSPKTEGNPYDVGEGGLGMSIIRSIAGEMFYRTQEKLNVLTVRFPAMQEL